MSTRHAAAADVIHPRQAPRTATRAATSGRRPETDEVFPVLSPRPREHRAAAHLPERPFWAYGVTVLAGYALLAALAIAVGLLLVHVLLPVDGLAHQDERLPAWLAQHRTGLGEDLSLVASDLGDIPAIPALVTVSALLLMWRRRWRAAGFIVTAILVEVATYRIASLLVHRDRPLVPRMDDYLPANQSYPSGHVAASVVVYGCLALLVSARCRPGWQTRACWALAVLLPIVVAFARIYRGMHHPLDALAGALIGIASITVALVAMRVYGAAMARRDGRPAREDDRVDRHAQVTA